jgi:Protein of unknown function (DUF2852)
MPIAMIALIFLGFYAWWPLGLAILFFLLWSRRMGCWNRHAFGSCGNSSAGWPPHTDHPHWQAKMERLQAKMDRVRSRMDNLGRGEWWGSSSSGNRAFDDYRTETLHRLEEEQREFKEFLQRLRFAKDRQEFDQFMDERRNRPPQAPDQAPPSPPQS